MAPCPELPAPSLLEILRQKRAQAKVNARVFLDRFGYLPKLDSDVELDAPNLNKVVRKLQKMYYMRRLVISIPTR